MKNEIAGPAVLLAEDDPPLSLVTRDALSHAGFAWEQVVSSDEAIDAFLERPARYRAPVTETALKGSLSGWELASKLREIAPRLPVIYLASPGADQWRSRGVPGSVRLEKPVVPDQLVTALCRLLTHQ